MQRINKLGHARRGATAIEYAVLFGLVVLAISTAIMLVGQSTARTYVAEPPAAVVIH